MKNWLPYPWQLDVWQSLHQQNQLQRLPHALLVVGEAGIGKQHFVDAFVAQLMCFKKQEMACGECKSCQLLMAGSHPAYIDIAVEEKSSIIKVDQIRLLVDFVAKTIQIGDVKIAVIHTAECMNTNAANSLLKSLEEPSNNTHIILLTHAPHRLLPTIRSRCRTIEMPKPNIAEADKWLATFITDESARQQLMLLANNNPLLAMQYADKEVVNIFADIIRQLVELTTSSSLTLQAGKIEKAIDIRLWLSLQQTLLSQLIRSSMNVISLPANLQWFSVLLTHQNFQKHAFKMLDDIQQAIKEVQHNNPNISLLIESLLIRWQWLLRL